MSQKVGTVRTPFSEAFSFGNSVFPTILNAAPPAKVPPAIPDIFRNFLREN
jgi:hypothetical protein